MNQRQMIMGFALIIMVFAFAIFYVVYQSGQPDVPDTKPPVTSPEISLKITWNNPTTDELGAELPVEEITGYDIYYTQDGSEREYAAWYPYNHAESDIREHIFDARFYGEYCFSLVTVTRSYGKSQPSDYVCYDHEEA